MTAIQVDRLRKIFVAAVAVDELTFGAREGDQPSYARHVRVRP